MADRVEPWIKHDGRGGPVRRGKMEVRYGNAGIGLPLHSNSFHPCWFWRKRWVRVGRFRFARLPVCLDPAYAPVVKYRFFKPPAASMTAAEMLEKFSKNPEGVDG